MKKIPVFKGEVQLLESIEEVEKYFNRCEEDNLLTFDWETTGLEYDAIPLGLSLHQRGVGACFIPVDFFFSKGVPMNELAKICNERFSHYKLIAHNAKYDTMINKMNGIKDECYKIFADTLVMVHLVNPSLDKQLEKRVAEDFGYVKKTFKEICGKAWNKINWSVEGDSLLDFLAGYAGEDTYWTTKLYYKYNPLMDEDAHRIHDRIELPLIPILRDAKIRGVLIDVPLLKEMGEQIAAELPKILDEVYEECGCVFNLNSSKQKAAVFFDKMKLPIISYSKKTGAPSTDAATFEEWDSMGIRVGALMNEYSELNKLYTGYVKAIPNLVDEHSVLRGDLNSCGTKTGRFASTGPNLQNQPNNYHFPIREAFVPRPGYKFVNYDYSQLELRVMAHMSKDSQFMDIFLHGRDPHGEVAKSCGITRKQAKCVNENTLIFTDKGVLRIGDVSTCRIKDTFDSPMISSVYNGSEMIGVNSFYSNGYDNTLAIITKRGIVRSSVNHQYVIADGTLKCARDLKIGDEISENAQLTYEGSETSIDYNPFFDFGDAFSIKMDSQWAYIAGVLTGDGCFSAKHIGISVGKGRFFKSWRKILKDEFAKKGLPLTERSNIYMYLGSSRFVKFMIPFGLSDECGKKNFKIPLWVLNGTIEMRKNFLGGLIDTDGTISETGTTSICTKSIQLAEDLCFLLNSIGYNFGVEPSWNSTYERWHFRIHIYSDSLSDLLSSNVIKCPHKAVSLTERVSKVGRGAKNSPNKVLQVLSLGTDYLCDLNVDSPSHLYMTGTLVTHNTMNFGVLYGMGIGKYMRTFNVSKARAIEMIDSYHKAYVGFAHWKESTENFAKKHGYVKNLFGRIRVFKETTKSKFTRNEAMYYAELRQAVNTIIQGTGADIVKLATIAMCRKFKELNLDAHFLLQVHDEVLIEVREDQMMECERVVIDCMENTVKLDVPLIADGKILANWGEMKNDDIVSYPYRFNYGLVMGIL